MDTIHDLGGREGFGPIPNPGEDDSAPFSEDWKARTWAVAMMTMAKLRGSNTGWSLDWYRHVLERLPPDLYLRADYFEKWVLGVMVTAVDEGIAKAEEFADGHARAAGFTLADRGPAKAEPASSGRFSPGDRVTTLRTVGAMHTRLPGYLRGRTGTVDSVICPQPVPEASATGTRRLEETYVVRFAMADLWPETEAPGDSLLVDLWDSYLEPA